ncbi:SDR family oxidoreductase [Chitinispirillales bacterium ANBcel5]|uniref:SDR family oxidoreductase n=1 Tax=Cellulosispirillum alkaliphilum TaxID=3039283 RepID=UPI002A5518A8|nr:SDR family oxidoreductase [Chitinispirillales bacterium ANBcel5]
MQEPLHHGSNLDFSPLNEDARLNGAPPSQSQQWPGTDQHLNPLPDHGEQSYVGGGKLEGKVALITGADSGIGKAVAIAFAREGADIAISYLNEHDDARDTKEWVAKAGRKCLLIDGDIQDYDHCKHVVSKTLQQYGRVNILINNAGVHLEQKDFTQISKEQLEQTFKTNVYSFFWITQGIVAQMKSGDSIINVGSVVALKGSKTLVDYGCTKAAIHNLTKSLSQQFSPGGIRVNCVAPGPVWTPLIPATRDINHVGKFGANSFWGRPAQPAEIAPSFVFLASSDSRYCTGEILAPTGQPFTSR